MNVTGLDCVVRFGERLAGGRIDADGVAAAQDLARIQSGEPTAQCVEACASIGNRRTCTALEPVPVVIEPLQCLFDTPAHLSQRVAARKGRHPSPCHLDARRKDRGGAALERCDARLYLRA